MRREYLLVILGLLTATPPGAAQSYGDPCRDVQRGRQAAGAVIGGLVGGLIGNGVAGRDVRDEGAAIGAVLGAVAGSQVARSTEPCGVSTYDLRQSSEYFGDRHAQSQFYPQAPIYHEYPRDYSERERSYWRPNEGEFEPEELVSECRKRLASGDRLDYVCEDDLAARECADVTQVTRLPDGTEIHKPAQACRVARYGDWRVED